MTSEFESWSEISGIKFGIILAYNPGHPNSIIKDLHLHNYHFQRKQKMEYMTTMVTSNGKSNTVTHSKWNYDKPLKLNKVTGKDDQILIVSP